MIQRLGFIPGHIKNCHSEILHLDPLGILSFLDNSDYCWRLRSDCLEGCSATIHMKLLLAHSKTRLENWKRRDGIEKQVI